jgi:hypothetical protein
MANLSDLKSALYRILDKDDKDTMNELLDEVEISPEEFNRVIDEAKKLSPLFSIP